jgi:hypothetical protein
VVVEYIVSAQDMQVGYWFEYLLLGIGSSLGVIGDVKGIFSTLDYCWES